MTGVEPARLLYSATGSRPAVATKVTPHRHLYAFAYLVRAKGFEPLFSASVTLTGSEDQGGYTRIN